MKRAAALLARIGTMTAVFLSLFVLGQDFLIFPRLRVFSPEDSLNDSIEKFRGSGLISSFIAARDGTKLEVWHLPAASSSSPKRAVIIFYGMGGSLPGNFPRQMMFQSLGISSFAVSLRGQDRSGGWPSEKGIEMDTEAVWDFAIEQEHLKPEQVIVMGESFGTGPAAYLAYKRKAGFLLLIAPYTDLKSAARNSNRFYSLLSPLMWYEFPTEQRIRQLEETCVIAVHGLEDQAIPYGHSLALSEAYSGRREFHLLLIPGIGHADLLALRTREIMEKIADCN